MEPVTKESSNSKPLPLDGFRSGDGAAFAEVVRAYTPLVMSVVSRFWTGAFEREEAAQEIWAHAFRQREALDPARLKEFGPWLKALARNRCIDLLRGDRRRIGPAHDDPSDALNGLQTAAAQERAVEAADLRKAVEAFKAALRPKWRSFFELHFVEGLGYPEIKERLSISRARCKYMKRVLVWRARRNMRLLEALGRYMGAGDDRAS